jgi:hypothetical protein
MYLAILVVPKQLLYIHMAAQTLDLALKLESLQQKQSIYSIKYAENTHPVIRFSKNMMTNFEK